MNGHKVYSLFQYQQTTEDSEQNTHEVKQRARQLQLKIVTQNTNEVKQRARLHFATASCERDLTRQNGLITCCIHENGNLDHYLPC